MTARVTRSSAAMKQASGQAEPVTVHQPVQLSTPPTTPGPNKKSKISNAAQVTSKPSAPKTLPAPKSKKRARATTLKDDDINELPHNLGSIATPSPNGHDSTSVSPAKKRQRQSKVTDDASPKNEAVQDLVAKATATPKTSPKKKNGGYGLTPGQTPYPNWSHPTPEECQEVARLLSTVHGEVKPPKTVPIPSLTVSGCGEVPAVLDALIRTRLSAATTGANSSRAFAGLVAKFGILQEGIGKGSVDWNKVRLAGTKEIFEAIKCGGLADVKSKDIKNILQMVWQENQERRAALTSGSDAPGSQNEGADEKKSEIEKAKEGVLSLDHLHLLSNDAAFNELVKYPGIGPKTASCVLLFCLQRPSFAVDTHVFRLSKWLGWIPPPGDAALTPADASPGSKARLKAPDRNSAFAHLDVRIPDDLKYTLHQLFIFHGKKCPRCRAITGENHEGWKEGCVIDHLVKRSGVRKSAGATPAKKGKGKKSVKVVEEEEEEEMEMSNVESVVDSILGDN